ncbi:hypothetical protein B0A54_13250 [Friedmanniomyces endolithicus]|uniref:Major facilitator superfamily (MFS) profile domain-containing protein n=1 Tax=Friedmanniomyces endolithicus TaxID=329885 RepID=A0A4U0UMZ8_9PEZI|nr:hypothetical protein LTS09_013573 [Friedmanniomyces endolithicus]TKA36316.1 hypothetical protein B0A54_13250 [Friedmanniomyces endolithicus]
MAAPEIKLPQEPSDAENHAFNPDIEKDESEKRPRDDSSSSVQDPDTIGADDEIIYHNLSFETSLPSPAYLARPPPTSLDPPRGPPPACPDLKKYTSPFLWSPKRKRLLTWMSVCATTITAYSAGSYTSTISQLTALWHVSDVAALVGVTLFTVGFAVAPMFLAPFSEINGRRPMFVVTGVLLVLFQLVCAVTPTFAGMLIARFLVGCAGSTFSTMVGGVVSDIYHAEDRNTAMSLFSGAALLGTGLGPVVSGFIAQNTTWRWVFYLQVITCGTVMVFIVFFFNETRGSVLLSRKAKALNQWYEQLESQDCYGMMMPTASDAATTAPQRIRWKVKSDEERVSIGKMIAISLYRPFHLLVTEPVVFFFSVWVSFAWGILYLLFSAIPLVFQNNHGFSLEGTDAVFAAICIGAILSTIIAIYQEPLARRYIGDKRRASLDTPEGRLYFACVQSSLLPIGCFWFAWTSFPSDHWIVPALAVGCATMGIFSIYLAVFNYLADTYGKYASSALAAQSFCRNMLGGAFPLFTKQMFTKMTYQGAGSFLGAVSALLTIVPWMLIFYGPRIRARSKIASEIMRESK